MPVARKRPWILPDWVIPVFSKRKIEIRESFHFGAFRARRLHTGPLQPDTYPESPISPGHYSQRLENIDILRLIPIFRPEYSDSAVGLSLGTMPGGLLHRPALYAYWQLNDREPEFASGANYR